MDRTSNDRKQLESILRESLLEIAQSGTDSLHQVVSEVVMSIEERGMNEAPPSKIGESFNKF